jgi:hypothetical protein
LATRSNANRWRGGTLAAQEVLNNKYCCTLLFHRDLETYLFAPAQGCHSEPQFAAPVALSLASDCVGFGVYYRLRLSSGGAMKTAKTRA